MGIVIVAASVGPMPLCHIGSFWASGVLGFRPRLGAQSIYCMRTGLLNIYKACLVSTRGGAI